MAYFDDLRFIGGAEYLHCHARLDKRFLGTWSIEYILEGKLAFGIDGGEQTVLDRPAVFWHTPRHTYQYGSVDKDGWHHHWLLLKGDRARRLVEDGFYHLSAEGYFPVRQAALVAEMFRSAIDLAANGGKLEHGEAIVTLEKLLCLLQAEAAEALPASPYAAGIAKLARQLDKEPERQWSFEEEARRLGLSYSRFRHIFREQVGAAPHDHLLQSRMRLAARLLQDRKLGVKQVAATSGYADIAQFSKLFKKKIGLSPRAYRDALPQT